MAAQLIAIGQDIYPYRSPTAPGGYHICVRLDPNNVPAMDVDHHRRAYDNDDPNGAGLARHGVRIPELMMVRLRNQDDSVLPMFRNQIRWQVCNHAFVSLNYEDITSSQCIWNQFNNRPKEYAALETHPYISAYPCFIPNPTRLLLGTGFPLRTKGNHGPYTRSYCRTAFQEVNQNMMFDITEDFIRPVNHPVDAQTLHYSNRTMFPTSKDRNHLHEQSTALYVCRGARLSVIDDMDSTKDHPHIRSFYQQGSLVVFRGGICFSDCVHDVKRRRLIPAIGLAPFIDRHLYPRETARRSLVGEESVDDTNINRLPDIVCPVIFLGSCESQFCSATWALSLERSYNYEGYCIGTLRFDDNGVIEDIAPWDLGFRLIWARHTYERLWWSVVFYADETETTPFVEDKDQYLLRRILGVTQNGEHWGRMTIRYQVEDTEDVPNRATDNNIRKYVGNLRVVGDNELWYRTNERLSGWHTSAFRTAIITPAPPLLPAIKRGDTYYWLHHDFSEQITQSNADQAFFRIEGIDKKYQLKRGDNIPGHYWVPATRDNWNELVTHVNEHNLQLDEWNRWSLDRVLWIKKLGQESDYQIKLQYLEEVEDDKKPETDKEKVPEVVSDKEEEADKDKDGNVGNLSEKQLKRMRQNKKYRARHTQESDQKGKEGSKVKQ